MSVASTVVLLRALAERRQIETVNGRIAVGWLIVEDLVTVLVLVLLPVLSAQLGGRAPSAAEGVPGAWALLEMVGKVSLFVLAMLVLGKKVIPRLLGRVARTGLRELFTLGVLAIALGIAFGAAALFGVSPALGAFFAGVVISESDLSHQADSETQPLQQAFTVLFFVSVGMLFDPRILIDQPLMVLAALFVVMVGKSLAAALIVLIFRYPIATALTVAASLAQIGEFSFILVGLGVSLDLVPESARSIVLAAAILSITLNPLIFRTIDPIDRWLRRRPRLLDLIEWRGRAESPSVAGSSTSDLSGHVVMVGYGRVGAILGEALRRNLVPFVVIEQDRNVIDELKKQGVATIFGDAGRPGILQRAGLGSARLLVVAVPGRAQVKDILVHVKKNNPDLLTCVRTHSYAEADDLAPLGVDCVVMGEKELALSMARFTLIAMGRTDEATEATLAELRAAEPPRQP